MKQANREMMKELTSKLYSGMPHDRAMAQLKKDEYPNSPFVKLNSGNYVLMDKYYKMLV